MSGEGNGDRNTNLAECMRVGILGGGGNLGKRLVEAGYESVHCELSNLDSMTALNGFDFIINCAGKYDLQWCQDNWVDACNINVFGIQKILDVYQGKFIHISCDSFYNGKHGFYSEEDKRSYMPHLNALASNKYFQEIAVTQNRENNYLIVRTSELYDNGTENIKILSKRIYDNRPISGSTSILFTPTYIPHLVIALQKLVERNIDGVINVAGRDYCTEEVFNKEFCQANNYNSFHAAGISHRPRNERYSRRLGLDTTKAENIGIPLFTLEQGMKELCEPV